MEKRETRRKRIKKTDYWKVADRFFSRLALAVLAVLIIVQVVMILFPVSGHYLNVALRLEGKPLDLEEQVLFAGGISSAPWASLSLKLVDYVSLPEAKVLVNGQEAGAFIHNEVTINVKHGDIVSVYNPNRSLPITVTVNKKTPNIREPALQSRVAGSGVLHFDPVVCE